MAGGGERRLVDGDIGRRLYERAGLKKSLETPIRQIPRVNVLLYEREGGEREGSEREALAEGCGADQNG